MLNNFYSIIELNFFELNYEKKTFFRLFSEIFLRKYAG